MWRKSGATAADYCIQRAVSDMQGYVYTGFGAGLRAAMTLAIAA
jgi:hypothetical protein